MELEVSSQFFIFAQTSFCCSWFRLQLIAIHCNRRGGGQNTFTRDFFSRTLSSLCTHHIVAQGVARRVCIKHVHPHVITCLSVFFFIVLSSSSVSRASTFSLTSTCFLFLTSAPIMSRTPSIKPKAHPQNEEYCPVAIYNPLTERERERGSEGERGRERERERGRGRGRGSRRGREREGGREGGRHSLMGIAPSGTSNHKAALTTGKK